MFSVKAQASLVICASVIMSSGCISRQLTRHTVATAATFPAVQYGQVLDNVARFAKNPAAVPFFSMPTGATAQITNTGSMQAVVLPNFILGASTNALWSGQYGPTASSAIQENWNITPITDPDKLRRMRCAYQYLICVPEQRCEDCVKEMRNFFCPKDCGRYKDGKIADPAKCELCIDCSLPRGWFHIGCKKDVPKNACYVGHDGDTYAWVCSDGLDGLARFTLSIMDLATKSPPKDEVVVRRIFKGEWKAGQPADSTEVTSREITSAPTAEEAKNGVDISQRQTQFYIKDLFPTFQPQFTGILPVP